MEQGGGGESWIEYDINPDTGSWNYYKGFYSGNGNGTSKIVIEPGWNVAPSSIRVYFYGLLSPSISSGSSINVAISDSSGELRTVGYVNTAGQLSLSTSTRLNSDIRYSFVYAYT